MMSLGYRPEWSEGSVKCPIFQTSTFVFESAEEGKHFFELAYGLKEPKTGEALGLIYSRLNNPDLEILENRLAVWDKAEAGAVFSSGMAAISTVLLEFLSPGDLLLYSTPLYGGTQHFIEQVLPKWGIRILAFSSSDSLERIEESLAGSGVRESLRLIYVETPANPTNTLIDLAAMKRLAEGHTFPDKEVFLAVDNTYLGPLWQHPIAHGADLVLYSATKYIGGHSDLIAGAVLGSTSLISRLKVLRTFMGNMTSPWTCWLLLRSLETLKIRMLEQQRNAIQVAAFLNSHAAVERVYYPGLQSHPQHDLAMRQMSGLGGAVLSLDVRASGAEQARARAFHVLDSLQVLSLATNLGDTKTLACHPASTSHGKLSESQRHAAGIGQGLIRIAVGLELLDDIKADLLRGLDTL